MALVAIAALALVAIAALALVAIATPGAAVAFAALAVLLGVGSHIRRGHPTAHLRSLSTAGWPHPFVPGDRRLRDEWDDIVRRKFDPRSVEVAVPVMVLCAVERSGDALFCLNKPHVSPCEI
jgi:hypothetical protein